MCARTLLRRVPGEPTETFLTCVGWAELRYLPNRRAVSTGGGTSKLVSLSIKTLAFHGSNSKNSQNVTVIEGADRQTFLMVSVLFVAISFAHAKPLLFS